MQMWNCKIIRFDRRVRMFTIWVCALVTLGTCCMAVVTKYDSLFDFIKSVPLVGLVVSYNFPPHDYYDPVLEFPIQEKDFEGVVSFKYKGRYDVQVANVSTPQLYHSGVSLEVVIYDKDSTPIWHSSASDSKLFAYGSADCSGYRYVYGSLSVPEDVPAKECFRVSISCAGRIEEFLSLHPNAVVQIRKCFDK